MNIIYEIKPNGSLNTDFTKWINTGKPHFQDFEHTLQIPIDKIKYVIVKEQKEISEIEQYIIDLYGNVPSELIIDTLENLKEKEE